MAHRVGDVIDECVQRFYLYELFESDTMQIFYVGQSNDPDGRIRAHRLDIDLGPVREHIRRLIARGAYARLRILDVETTREGSISAEIRKIAEYRGAGVDLLNRTPRLAAQKCRMCHGRGMVAKRARGTGVRGGWFNVSCVCTRGALGAPPLSKAILDAHERAGEFETMDDQRSARTAQVKR